MAHLWQKLVNLLQLTLIIQIFLISLLTLQAGHEYGELKSARIASQS